MTTKVEPTVEGWEREFDEKYGYLKKCNCGGEVWHTDKEHIEEFEDIKTFIRHSVQEAKAEEADKITYDSVVPTWVGDEPAWTLIAIQNGEVIWESRNPVTKRDIQSVYHRETGRYASTVATVEETRVAAKYYHLKSTLNTKASLKQEEEKV